MSEVRFVAVFYSIALLHGATAASWPIQHLGDVSTIDLLGQLNGLNGPYQNLLQTPYYTISEVPAVRTAHLVKHTLPLSTHPSNTYLAPLSFDLTPNPIGLSGFPVGQFVSQLPHAAHIPAVSPVTVLNHLNDIGSVLKPVSSAVGSAPRPLSTLASSTRSVTSSTTPAPSASTHVTHVSSTASPSVPTKKLVKTAPNLSVSAIEEALVAQVTPVATNLVSKIVSSYLDSIVPVVRIFAHQLAPAVHDAVTSYVVTVSKSVSNVQPSLDNPVPTSAAVAEAVRISPVPSNAGVVPVSYIVAPKTVSGFVNPTMKSILSPISYKQIKTIPLIEPALTPVVKTLIHPAVTQVHI